MLLYQQPVLLNAMDLNDSACTGLLYPVSWLNTSGKFFPNFVSGDFIFSYEKPGEKRYSGVIQVSRKKNWKKTESLLLMCKLMRRSSDNRDTVLAGESNYYRTPKLGLM